MKVYVVFDFPEIKGSNSEDTFAIDSLSKDLDGEYDWYIDNITED